jgi:hypothetical protein
LTRLAGSAREGAPDPRTPQTCSSVRAVREFSVNAPIALRRMASTPPGTRTKSQKLQLATIDYTRRHRTTSHYNRLQLATIGTNALPWGEERAGHGFTPVTASEVFAWLKKRPAIFHPLGQTVLTTTKVFVKRPRLFPITHHQEAAVALALLLEAARKAPRARRPQ